MHYKTPMTISLVFTLLCQSSIGFGQQPPGDVAFVAYWAKGDQYLFDVIKVKEESRDGKVTKYDSTSYKALFTVQDSTADSYTVSWRVLDGYWNKGDSESDELLASLAEEIDQVVYTTTETGAFKALQNGWQIRRQLNDLFDATIQQVAQTRSISVDTLRKAMEPLRKAFTSDDGITQLFFREIQEFHSPMGGAFSPTDTIRFVNEFPDLIQGGTMPADAVFYFNKIDTTESYCQYTLENKLGEEGLKRMLTSLFSQMGLSTVTAKDLERMNVYLKDVNVCGFYYYPCLPDHIEVSRQLKFVFETETRHVRQRLTVKLVSDDDAE